MLARHRIPLTLLILGYILLMPAAQAHTSLVSSNPAIHANLAILPSHVQVEFDENLIVLGSAKSNILQVLDAQGRNIDAGNSKTSGSILGIDLKDRSGQGTFTVSWRVVSADGHPVEGSYQFSVAAKSQTLVPKTPTPVHQENSFWNRHNEQIYVSILAIIAIGIWARFEWRRRNVS